LSTLDGTFALGAEAGSVSTASPTASIFSRAAGSGIDYKSGREPDVKRALQWPSTRCAQETLAGREGGPLGRTRRYVALGGASARSHQWSKPPRRRDDAAQRPRRLQRVLAGIARGEFPARPFEPRWCRYCAYSSICRKDYIDDE
jgi:hypothetical protein